MAGREKEPVISFPLSLLAYGENWADRIKSIISYSIYAKAKNLKFESDIFEMNDKLPKPDDFNSEDSFHRKIISASDKCGVILSSVTNLLEEVRDVSEFIQTYEKRLKSDAYAQISTSLAFKTLESQFDYKLFAFICGLSSKLGRNHKYLSITINDLKCRMLGFKNKNSMESILQDPIITDAGKRLSGQIMQISNKQVIRLRDKAENLNFFRKYTYNKGQTFYSTQLSDKELINSVLEKKYQIQIRKERHKLLETEAKKRLGVK